MVKEFKNYTIKEDVSASFKKKKSVADYNVTANHNKGVGRQVTINSDPIKCK